jgi:phage-related protein
MAGEQLNLDLRVNSAQLVQGLTTAIASLTALQQSLNGVAPAAKGAASGSDQAKTSIAGAGQSAASAANPITAMAAALRAAATVANATGTGLKTVGQSAYNAGVGVQASGSKMQTGLQGTLNLTNLLATRIGLIGTSTSVAAIGFAKLRAAIGGSLSGITPQAGAASAAISGIGLALQRIAGVGASVGGILAGFSGAMFSRFGQGIGNMASRLQGLGGTGSGAFGRMASAAQGVVSKIASAVQKSAALATGIASAAGKLSGFSGLAGIVGNFAKMAKQVGAVYLQAKAMTAMTQSLDHLASGIIDFNSTLQTANVAFETLITNEIRRGVVAAGDLKTALDGGTDKFGNDMKGINKIWNETMGIYTATTQDGGPSPFSKDKEAGSNLKLTIEDLIKSYNTLKGITNATAADVQQAALENPAFFTQVVEGTEAAKHAAQDYVTLLKNYANVTPFRFPEILDMSKKMRAYGFAAEETVPAINAIGEAVAAMGGSEEQMQRIGYALGQMRNSGRVYQRQMMQLANAGINGYEILGEQLFKKLQAGSQDAIDLAKKATSLGFDVTKGFSVEAVRALTRIGALGGRGAADALLTGMQDRFQGSQDRLGNTFAGAMATIADTSQTLMATSFKPFFDFMGSEDPNSLGFIQKFKDLLLSPELANGANTIAAGMDKFLNAVTGGKGPQVLIDGIAQGFKIIAAVLSEFIFPVIGYLSMVTQFWVDVIAGALQPLLGLVDTFAVIFNGVEQGGQKTQGIFEMLGEIYNTVLAPMITIVSAIADGFTMMFQGLFTTIQGIFEPLQALISALYEGFAALSPIITFIGAFIGLISGLLGVVFNVVAGIITGILNAFQPIFKFIGDLFGQFAGLIDIIQQNVMPLIMFLGNIIGKVFGFFGTIIGTIIGGPLSILSTVMGAIVGGIGSGIKAVAGFFAGIINGIIDQLNKLIDVYNATAGNVFGKMDKIKNVKLDIFTNTTSKTSTAVSGAGVAPNKPFTLDDLFDPTLPAVGDMRGGVTKPKKGGGGGGKNKWDDFDAKLKAWIDKVKSETKKMYEVEIDAIEDVKNAQKKQFESTKEAAKRAHEARMRQFEDEKTAQDRFFDDATEGINDQRDLLNKASDERKSEDDRAKLERDLAFAIAQQASGTLDPLEAARNVAEARAALDDFNLSAQEQAALDALDVQAEAIDDQRELWERDYADRKDAEKRAYDDALQALEDQHTTAMDLMTAQQEALKTQMEADLLAFENNVMDMAALLKQGKMTGADFAKETLKEFETLGNNYEEIGETLGKNLAYGLQKSKKVMDTAAKELAAIIAKYLKVKSPTEAGPLAEDQSNWGSRLAKNMLTGMKDTFKGDFAMKIGLGDFVNQLTGVKPMKLGLEGTMGNVTVMNFNFAPGSIRDDKDIYALAEAVEKRMTRTLRQR